MSVIVAILTSVPQASLRSARPAWIEIHRRSGFGYVREDHNTPWLRVDDEGRFLGVDSLVRELEAVRERGGTIVAVVQLQNRESIDAAVDRAASLPPVASPHDIRLDTAVVL